MMTQIELPLMTEAPSCQADEILLHLQTGRTLTALEALRLFGCLRLGARIYDLKRRGWRIEKEMIQTASGKWVAEYSLGV